VIVVDNDSPDDTLEMLARWEPRRLRDLPADEFPLQHAAA
jgi:glycosyltransferase involved in cell wall biosynthesis